MKMSFHIFSAFVITFFSQIVFAQQKDSLVKKPVSLMTAREMKLRMITNNLSDYTYIVGKSLGSYAVSDLNGKPITKDSMRNKIVFYNFWFESCHYCHHLFEPLNALYEHYKNEPRFEILSFTFDTKAVLLQNIIKYKLQYRNIATTNNICHSLMFDKGFPANLLVDGSGKIVLGTGSLSFASQENYLNETLIPQIDKLLAELTVIH